MNERFMHEAIKQAKKALKNGDIPVGAIIVKDNEIIAKAYNRREEDKDATGHAELIAIKKACKRLNDWRLNGCTLFVTLEPCNMCKGAAVQARIDQVVYGAKNTNVHVKKNSIIAKKSKNKEINVMCSNLLKKFFENKRK